MDIFSIKQLRIETLLGVHPFEQKVPQTISVDLEFKTDITQAAKTQDLKDAVDYSQVAAQLTQFITNRSFILIEALAEQAAQFLKQEFHLPWIKLKISKIGCIPNAKEVSLEIIRE